MISVLKVTEHFDEVHALVEVDFDTATGEFITIVGPSGCCKSTLLRIIAGLINSTEGSVNKPDTSLGAFVFQDAALLPWRNVQRNAELLMELEDGFSKQERVSRVSSALQQVGLEGFEKSYPHQLSGGMKMRLSLARALVLRPDYLLLDEPLSAVDELTRELLQEEIHSLWKKEKFTAILVTHNVTEEVYISKRVVDMSRRPGQIINVVDVRVKKRNQEMREDEKSTENESESTGKERKGR